MLRRRSRSKSRGDLALWTALFLLPLALVAGAADEELDDLMGGFEDDPSFDAFEADEANEVDSVEDDEPTHPAWHTRIPVAGWLVERSDLSGSLSLGAVYSYLDHKVPHGDVVGRSTSYGNLTRLDLDGFLQLDIDLPGSWKIRAEALGWYDFSYRIKGRGDYGGAVLDVYEWQVDTGEFYLTGPLNKNVDITIGRKIVNWGRSDTFRVVDVINPLDNKEPGLVDIEDLRRPRTMVKLDVTSREWSAQLLVLPENRYNRSPPPGSDFYPDLSNLPPSLQATVRSAPVDGRSDFSGLPGLAAKVDGRFSGWDFSVYGAYVDESSRRLDFVGPVAIPTGLRNEANRFGLLGAAGNVIRGAWLFKVEVAWLTELRVFRFRRGVPLPSSDDKDRFDSMLGVEYYGPDNLTIALEVVNRHLLNEPTGPMTIQLTPQSRFESALRISRPFFRERLNLTALAVGFGERLQNGGLFRFSGDYELDDSWGLEAGILIFMGGPDQGLGAFESNDRIYAELEYNF